MKYYVGQGKDFHPGAIVTTPCGRRAIVIKVYGQSSKFGRVERVTLRYLDGTRQSDTVALQPELIHLLISA
jgi:hypothetical protein